VQTPVSTGCSCIDQILNGGLAAETITMIYGEPETGKTTLAIQAVANCALQQNLKTLYVDCDGTFATERLLQITQGKFEQASEKILLVKPKDFAEQTVLVENLTNYTSGCGLVVFDTFNSLYRVQIADVPTKISFAINRELNRLMALVAEAAKTQHIPIIVTSQVKAVFDETSVSVAPVATRVLQFWANNIISLKPTQNQQVIEAAVRRNQNPQEVTCYLMITQAGIHDIQK
jgi:DNA repair protein RadB